VVPSTSGITRAPGAGAIAISAIQASANSVSPGGSIQMSAEITGENVGYVHYYRGKFNAYQRTYVLTGFNSNIHYLNLYLDRFLEARITAEVNAGNTPYIKMGTLTDMEIAVPIDIEEQTAIAQIISDMDAEIEELEQKLDKYKMIKQGMMQELLTGKTRLI